MNKLLQYSIQLCVYSPHANLFELKKNYTKFIPCVNIYEGERANNVGRKPG